jgi:hypothetical protein
MIGDSGEAFVLMCGDGGNDVGALKVGHIYVIYVNKYESIYIFTNINTNTNIDLYTYLYIHVVTYIYEYVYIHVFTYIHIYTYSHTYIAN